MPTKRDFQIRSNELPAAEGISSKPAVGVSQRYGALAARDDVYRIATARIVLVDYERVFADFEQLRPSNLVAANPDLGALSDGDLTKAVHAIVDAWLLDNAAVMSAAQTTQCTVNTPIEVCGPVRCVFRPPQYGRACVVPTRALSLNLQDFSTTVQVPASGELDVKGAGVRKGVTPTHVVHSNGLLALKNAIEEYLMERLIELLLTHAGSPYRTLPNYAILDTGFDGLTSTNERYATGLLVRRAHMRNVETDVPNCDTPDQYATFGLEKLFRRYGITSAERFFFEIRREDGRLVAYQWRQRAECAQEILDRLVTELGLEVPFEAEGINIQMDFDEESQSFGRQIVDFGHYTARRTFSRAIVSGVCDRPFGWGGVILPSDSCFVQADPRLVLKRGLWDDTGPPNIGPFDTFAAELVADIRSGKVDQAGIQTKIKERLKGLVSKWPQPGSQSSAKS